jgi:rhodanese-related sulfurtransferase
MERSYQRLPATAALDWISQAQLSGRPYALFDTRDPAARQGGMLPGAQPLNEAGFGAARRALPKEQAILIYCYHGNASQVFAQMFADFGHREVYSVDGGYQALALALAEPKAPAVAPSANLAAFLADHGYPADNIEALIDNRTTPLMRAARLGRDDIVEELLRFGAAPDTRNADGNTALWLGCFANSQAVVACLIKAGANIDNRNDNGVTALMYASSSGRPEMVEALLKAGADDALENLDGFTALELSSTVECLRLLRRR